MTTKLAKDDQTLLIVNCARSWQEVEKEHVYICPATGGNYRYRPSRYFGIYHDRKVSHVANIEAVVDVAADDTTTIRWVAVSGRDEIFQRQAVAASKRLRPKDQFPFQVFILGEPQTTDFRKDSRGGMMGSKLYVDVSSTSVDTAGYLAGKLSGKKWSDFKSVATPASENGTASPGKYTPLANWFLNQPTDKATVTLSFEKIEEIIGDELPPSAWEYTAWWLDKSANTTHTHAFSWLETGWQVEEIDLEEGKVSFNRVL